MEQEARREREEEARKRREAQVREAAEKKKADRERELVRA
jgi:hypothetical protein